MLSAAMNPAITFARLSTIPEASITAHMSDPRVTAHLPLLTQAWDAGMTRDFVTRKEAAWERDGLGHWAILSDGAYIGWGGFEKEGEDWDFGLVLTAAAFGFGLAVAKRALERARADPRIESVTFLLPLSRRHLGGLVRLGAKPEGEVELHGTRFRKFRLATG